jgi:prevent-host-death family protein
MSDRTDERKQEEIRAAAAPAVATLVRARDVLGEIVDRAAFDGQPTVITRRGRGAAVVISMRDFARLTAAA